MKTLPAILLATAASAFTTAAPAMPFNYNGYFQLSFTYPGGTFQHCIGLTDTEYDQGQGYTYSGTWVDTDFANTSGTWVVYDDTIHFAGQVDGGGYLTFDGHVGDNKLRRNATFDYFAANGTYFAAGSIMMAADTGCASPLDKMPDTNSRSFLK